MLSPLQPSEPPLPLSPLPTDIQVEILSRVGDVVTVVRCAATCKAWHRLIKEPGFLSHLHCHRRAEDFDPSTLLGFFFRDTSESLPRRRLYRCRPTRFLLLSNSSSKTSAPMVIPLSRFLMTVDGLDTFAPVASGDGGLLALCGFSHTSRHITRIYVYNPLARTSTMLPFLPFFVIPEKITFLEADSNMFRLLVVMDTQEEMLIMCVFSSQFGDRGWDMVTVELPNNVVVHIDSPTMVHRGAVHWICGTLPSRHAVHALAVRPTEAGTPVSRFNLPPRAGMHCLTSASMVMRLVNSAQGALSLILVDEQVLFIWNVEEHNDGRKFWPCYKAICLTPMLSPIISCHEVKLSIQGFCEKSGFVFLHVVGEGIFLLNLETRKLVKIYKGHFTKYLCPYVTDFASCLKDMKKF